MSGLLSEEPVCGGPLALTPLLSGTSLGLWASISSSLQGPSLHGAARPLSQPQPFPRSLLRPRASCCLLGRCCSCSVVWLRDGLGAAAQPPASVYPPLPWLPASLPAPPALQLTGRPSGSADRAWPELSQRPLRCDFRCSQQLTGALFPGAVSRGQMGCWDRCPPLTRPAGSALGKARRHPGYAQGLRDGGRNGRSLVCCPHTSVRHRQSSSIVFLKIPCLSNEHGKPRARVS